MRWKEGLLCKKARNTEDCLMGSRASCYIGRVSAMQPRAGDCKTYLHFSHSDPSDGVRHFGRYLLAGGFGWYLAVDSAGDEMHDDVVSWNHFPHYWPFVRGIHQLISLIIKRLWCRAFVCEQSLEELSKYTYVHILRKDIGDVKCVLWDEVINSIDISIENTFLRTILDIFCWE